MAKARPGRFVTFEGGDGVGKTTQTRRLAKRIRDEFGQDAMVTNEPGGSLIGNGIRALLVSRSAAGKDMDERFIVFDALLQHFESGELKDDAFTAYHALLLAPGNVRSSTTEALLHFAARSEHWEFALKPMLDKGRWVICDRFTDSTMAYQGYGGGQKGPAIGRERIELMAKAAIPGVAPNLTFVLDLDPAVGLARAATRKGEASSYELLTLDYHRRVRDGFLDIAKRDPKRCRVIDASQSEDAVADAIWREIQAYLAREPQPA
jgi:dTMP kinase